MLIITPKYTYVRNLVLSKVPYIALFSQCLWLEMRELMFDLAAFGK